MQINLQGTNIKLYQLKKFICNRPITTNYNTELTVIKTNFKQMTKCNKHTQTLVYMKSAKTSNNFVKITSKNSCNKNIYN